MKNFLAFLYLSLPTIGLAQPQNNASPFLVRNTIYAEALGSGGFYSINYDRLVILRQKQVYGFRIGTSFYGKSSATVNLIGELFTIVGKGNHHGDFGIGLTKVNQRGLDLGVSSSTSRYTTLYAVPRVSYRYQKPTGGLMLRAGFTPIAKLTNRVDSTKFSFGPWLGLAVGYNF